jgi:hypothetical protein
MIFLMVTVAPVLMPGMHAMRLQTGQGAMVQQFGIPAGPFSSPGMATAVISRVISSKIPTVFGYSAKSGPMDSPIAATSV